MNSRSAPGFSGSFQPWLTKTGIGESSQPYRLPESARGDSRCVHHDVSVGEDTRMIARERYCKMQVGGGNGGQHSTVETSTATSSPSTRPSPHEAPCTNSCLFQGRSRLFLPEMKQNSVTSWSKQTDPPVGQSFGRRQQPSATKLARESSHTADGIPIGTCLVHPQGEGRKGIQNPPNSIYGNQLFDGVHVVANIHRGGMQPTLRCLVVEIGNVRKYSAIDAATPSLDPYSPL